MKLIIFLLVLISCNKKSSNLEFQNQTKIENGISDKLIYDFVNEIAVLTVHGLCHLLGFDHELGEEESLAQMQAEIEILQKANLEDFIGLIARSNN